MAEPESPLKSPSPEKLKRDISTPYLLRKMKQTKYAHTMPSQKYDSDDSGDSATSSDSSSESDDTDDAQADRKLSSEQQRRVSQLDNSILEDVRRDNIEGYFHSRKGTTTSNKTINDLELEELNQDTITRLLSKLPTRYDREREALFTEHTQSFVHWYVYLREGFNMVLYGVGSKRKLLIHFAKKMLKYEYHVVVNGYFPNLTVRDILNNITHDLLGSTGTYRSLHDQLSYIRSSTHDHIFLLINNIDGTNLRNDKSQQTLAELAAIEHVHIIATIDHINAPLLWDDNKTKLFNWLWADCTTLSSYTDETSIESSLMLKQAGGIALSSMTHVLRSLTPNAKGIFKLLATFQQENGPDFQGIGFQEFYIKCREQFLVNSDATLRSQLTEFKDHMLIKTRNVDGSEVLYIPVESKILNQFIESNF